MKMRVRELMVEVTRRCNLSCDHCVRGEPEDVDLRMIAVQDLLGQIESIGTIVFTGGEPSLADDEISLVLNVAKRLKLEIGSFYLATNAVDISDDFLMTLMRWFLYCHDSFYQLDEGMQAVQWSDSIFHTQQGIQTGINKLKCLSFAGPKEHPKGYKDLSWVKSEGRGENFAENPVKHYEPVLEIYEDEITVEDTEVYLNVHGEIIFGCDWSYESQEKRIFCEAHEFKDKIIQMAEEKDGVS